MAQRLQTGNSLSHLSFFSRHVKQAIFVLTSPWKTLPSAPTVVVEMLCDRFGSKAPLPVEFAEFRLGLLLEPVSDADLGGESMCTLFSAVCVPMLMDSGVETLLDVAARCCNSGLETPTPAV